MQTSNLTRALGAALLIFTAHGAAAQQADLAVVTPVVECSALVGTDLSAIAGAGSSVLTADLTTSDGIPVCNVTGKLAPEINFQVLLPTETWTQRYLQTGCGGLCGSISLRSGASAGCQVLTDGGMVMAATDMGHQGMDPAWTLDELRTADFAYRAQHLTAVATKELIAKFYGQPEQYAYFNGCSDGGREALMEAQRFPDDFDGIVAGAPAMLFQVQNTLYHGWQATANMAADGSVVLTSDRLPVLYRAVLAACDAKDGLADGILSQPATCDFDPQSIVCDDPAQCLTQAEADTVTKLYAGPQDAATGAYLTAGQPVYGSELEWQGVFVADDATSTLFSMIITDPVLKFIAFTGKNPDYQLADLPFTEATLDALRPRHGLLDSTNPDLSAFNANGGKLILWHGMSDQHIAPANTLSYHNALIETLGADTVNGFERLYLLPGVGHCSGGQGPSNVNLLGAVMDWVEGGTAPEAIIAASTSEPSNFGIPDVPAAEERQRPPMLDLGVAPLPDMTRPVYPYPFTAAYTGTGDVNDAANWTKGEAAQIIATRDWPGADLFRPYDSISVSQ